jgi:hypothetical protein
MQKRKFFIILAIIIIIPLIGLSAQCGGPSEVPGEAPTLKLEIYDGPDYSESDNMCYYRVEATVTGMPEIEFAADDNVNPLGPGRVEVGVDIGDSYTLTATAKNSAGTATGSITLLGECSGAANSKETAAEEAPADEEESAEEEELEEEAEEEETDISTNAVKEAPTISLTIYEGPTLDGSICYYRIEATVTGSPTPSVSFSKDDSGGAWGSKKTQINLNDPNETYNLTTTATNSEGTATDSITLSWGCAIPDPDPIEENVDIGAYVNLSGMINVDVWVEQGVDALFVGDSSFNKQVKAFLSFDIHDLGDIDGINIKDVSVSIPIDIIIGYPYLLGGSEVDINVCYYGDSLTSQALNYAAILVKTISASDSTTIFNFSSNTLKNELQKAVDLDKKWFQLKIETGAMLANGIWDYYKFYPSDTVLRIKYEVP